MKIAIVSDTFHPQKNGVVVFLEDFIKQLARKAEIIVLAPGEKNFLVKNKTKNITYYHLPSLPFPFYPGYRMSTVHRRDIKKIFEKEKPDVVHLHAPVLAGLKALYVSKNLGLPTVVTYHTHFPDYVSHLSLGILRGKVEDLAKVPVKRLIKSVFSKADIITAPTPALQKELSSYGLQNVQFIPNGIDFSKFKNSKKIDVRKKHSIPKEKRIILYVGRISFEKRLDVLLSAFKKISEKRDDVFLLIAGGGPYLDDYTKLAQAMGLQNIAFAGFVPDENLSSYYAAADLFVSASDTETFGLTFVEAMFFGLPVVGVNRLGASDVITQKVGLLAEPSNSTDLARCISLVLDHKKLFDEFKKNAKKEAQKYSIENTVRSFMKIYKKFDRF